jgi:hypothetical protein
MGDSIYSDYLTSTKTASFLEFIHDLTTNNVILYHTFGRIDVLMRFKFMMVTIFLVYV